MHILRDKLHENAVSMDSPFCILNFWVSREGVEKRGHAMFYVELCRIKGLVFGMAFEGIVVNTISLDIFWHYLENVSATSSHTSVCLKMEINICLLKIADNGGRSDNIEEGKCEE